MLKSLMFALALLVTGPVMAQEAWTTIPAPPAMPAADQSGTAPVNGIEMYYALYGADAGTPILLIHGGLAHADIWAAQVADLMQDHRVLVADTRGHGRSTNDGSDYSYELLAQDRLASHFAHAGNVTLDGIDPGVETNEVFGTYVGMMAEDYARLSPTPDGFGEFLGGVAAMWGTDKPGGLEALESVTVPTLVVQSAHDEAILMSHSEAMAAAIPGADLLILDDVSHFAMLQDPDGYIAAIRDFVK